MNPTGVHRWAYELTGGRIGGRLGGGVRAALLTTTGRKTGRSRTVPLVYTRDGADYVFVGVEQRLRPAAGLAAQRPGQAGGAAADRPGAPARHGPGGAAR